MSRISRNIPCLHHAITACVLRSLAAFLSALFLSVCVHAAGNYVLIRLPRGVTVELPKNWTAISGNQVITLDAWVQAGTERLSAEPSTSELAFAANYYDDRRQTAGFFNIRYYPAKDITQSEAQAATPADVKELDDALRQGLASGVDASGNKILEWRGTRKVNVNGVTAFLSDYRRTSPQGIPFRTQLVRVFNGPKSFTVTIAYREDQHYFLSAICDRIIQSIRT